MNKQISIIGCGWLGLPLAQHFIKENYIVKGSTTSKDKLSLLKSEGIQGFYVELTENLVEGAIENCLSGSEILILNIPPGLRKDPKANFVKRISHLIPQIEKSSIKHVIFVSSTSVYADDDSIPMITEDTIPNPDTESGGQLWEVETQLQTNQNFSTTIVRFSGLFGPNRHPATFLSGKKDLKNPDAPVNLVHLDDCISIIYKLVQKGIWNETLNVATTPHLSKKEYYQTVCLKMGLPLPLFVQNSSNAGKWISTKKIEQLINYEFQVKLNN